MFHSWQMTPRVVKSPVLRLGVITPKDRFFAVHHDYSLLPDSRSGRTAAGVQASTGAASVG
jgi:hypothetical protein